MILSAESGVLKIRVSAVRFAPGHHQSETYSEHKSPARGDVSVFVSTAGYCEYPEASPRRDSNIGSCLKLMGDDATMRLIRSVHT